MVATISFAQSVTNIFENSDILVTNIYSDIHQHKFFFYKYSSVSNTSNFFCRSGRLHFFIQIYLNIHFHSFSFLLQEWTVATHVDALREASPPALSMYFLFLFCTKYFLFLFCTKFLFFLAPSTFFFLFFFHQVLFSFLLLHQVLNFFFFFALSTFSS